MYSTVFRRWMEPSPQMNAQPSLQQERVLVSITSPVRSGPRPWHARNTYLKVEPTPSDYLIPHNKCIAQLHWTAMRCVALQM